MLHRTTRPYEIALGTWARCKAGFFGFREVALAGLISQTAGWDVEALGFTRINVHGPMEVPRLTRLSLDLSSRYDTDFVAPDDQAGNVLFGASFADPHPEAWWNAIYQRRCALVILDDMAEMTQNVPGTFEEFRDRLSRMYVADVPLLTHTGYRHRHTQ